MSFSRYQVPIAVICEITGIREDHLIKDFRGLIGEDATSLPLDALPQDVQDIQGRYGKAQACTDHSIPAPQCVQVSYHCVKALINRWVKEKWRT